jgi:predicted phosphoribosyltransferase
VFTDRTEAGGRLASVLRERGIDGDAVLAVPRGGLPVGRAVADALDRPLDVIVARKFGAPSNAEVAIGAVAPDGSLWRNDDLIARLDVDEAYVEAECERQADAAREKRERYRGTALDLSEKTALIVDDGIATGATMIACVRAAAAGAARVVAGAPVASPQAVARIEREADAVVCVEVPENFGAVGRYYRSFEQVSDEEALSYLE